MSISPPSQAPRWDTHAHVFAGPVLPGSHYTPTDHSLAMWHAAVSPSGIDRVVLVQPSVYGADNTIMLDALRESGGVHRGVVVLDKDVSDRALEKMHAAGVRGVRFNLVSPMGNDASSIDAILARVHPLGWHVQFACKPVHVAWVHENQARWRVPIVLDHLGGLRMDENSAADFDALCALADAGAWVKLSGYYRLGASAPFEAADPLIDKVHARFAGRALWGSDWPHTWHMESQRGAAPAYETLLAPLMRVFSEDVRQSILCDAPAQLYK
ncbi:MAG: amidohydrolase family protein [Usitatibacteraceae bacterium]